MQQSHVIPSPRSFACDLATLCAPTLAGLKPASLFRYQPAPGQDAAARAAAEREARRQALYEENERAEDERARAEAERMRDVDD